MRGAKALVSYIPTGIVPSLSLSLSFLLLLLLGLMMRGYVRDVVFSGRAHQLLVLLRTF